MAGYFEHLKTVFNFSEGSLKDINMFFPYYRKLNELFRGDEVEYGRLLFELRELRSDLYADLSKYGYDILGCNPQTKSLRYGNPNVEHKNEFEYSKEEIKLIKLDELNSELENQFSGYYITVQENIDKLFKITVQLNDIKNILEVKHGGRPPNLWMSVELQLFFNLHSSIQLSKRRFLSILSELLNGVKLKECSGIERILSAYNDNHIRSLVITGDNRLNREPVITEDTYLGLDTKDHGFWETLLRQHLAYFFIEYLKSENSVQCLRQCKECNKFFVSKTKRPQKYCSDKCRLSHHNKKRIESGEHAAYKRKKRKEGARESYYG